MSLSYGYRVSSLDDIRPSRGSTSNDDLSDGQLLDRERDDHDDFRREQAEQPRFGDTTFGLIRGSPRLIAAWERWWETNLAARMRGLLARGIDR